MLMRVDIQPLDEREILTYPEPPFINPLSTLINPSSTLSTKKKHPCIQIYIPSVRSPRYTVP